MLLKRRKKYDIKSLLNKINNENVYKNFFLFIMGLAIGSIAVSLIYNRYNIVTSGSTGIAILLNKIFQIDLSVMVLVVCSILLVIGFAVFGIEYGSKNILITILSPIFIKTASLLNYIINFDEMSVFLLAVFAGLLSGISTGLIRRSGYSPGGLCVVYDILNRKFKISVGNASLITNTLIMIVSLFSLGLTAFIYGFIALYISSTITDRVMIGISNNKAFYIITRNPLEVKEYIISKLHHTVTIVNAKGGYSNKKKKMLMCVIPTTEYTRVKEVVREIDRDAFFLITDSYYVSKSRKFL